jgi:hypothetical protein
MATVISKCKEKAHVLNYCAYFKQSANSTHLIVITINFLGYYITYHKTKHALSRVGM